VLARSNAESAAIAAMRDDGRKRVMSDETGGGYSPQYWVA
jgi:hypothetical protein